MDLFDCPLLLFREFDLHSGWKTGKMIMMVKIRMLLFEKWSLWFGGTDIAVLVCECDGG